MSTVLSSPSKPLTAGISRQTTGIFSPQPLKRREINPRMISSSFIEKKSASLDFISFSFPCNRSESYHYIPLFEEISESEKIPEEKEKIGFLEILRKECGNPHDKDPGFGDFSGKNLDFLDIDL